MKSTNRYQRTLFLAAILLTAFAASAAADPEGPGRGRGQRWMEKLDLTQDQQEAIETIRTDARSQHLELRKEIMRLENEREGELLKDKPSSKTVLDITGKIGEIRSELAVDRMSTKLAIRELLTPEQRDQMLMMKDRGEGRQRFRGRDRGPRGIRSSRGPGAQSRHGNPVDSDEL